MHSTRGPKHSSEVLSYLFVSYKVSLIHSSMFIHVKPKTLVQSVRFVLFSILDSLVAKHRDGMHLPSGLLPTDQYQSSSPWVKSS